ncbi:MAG: NifB/NifX family molybdenum-iron cluster-binding protein [Candidatus Thorarchaeota archaeon]
MPVIALPSEGEGGLNETLSLRFGRCDNLTIVTIEKENIEAVKVIPIQKNKAFGNLGIFVANIIKENRVSDVIVRFIGSKAYKALSSENVKIFQALKKDLSIRQCIDLFTQGKIHLLKEPNAHLIKD